MSAAQHSYRRENLAVRGWRAGDTSALPVGAEIVGEFVADADAEKFALVTLNPPATVDFFDTTREAYNYLELIARSAPQTGKEKPCESR